MLMLQHASQFSFDRLKFIIPATILFSVGFASLKINGRIMLSLLLLVASIHGWISYKNDLKGYKSWAAIDAANRDLATRVWNATLPDVQSWQVI